MFDARTIHWSELGGLTNKTTTLRKWSILVQRNPSESLKNSWSNHLKKCGSFEEKKGLRNEAWSKTFAQCCSSLVNLVHPLQFLIWWASVLDFKTPSADIKMISQGIVAKSVDTCRVGDQEATPAKLVSDNILYWVSNDFPTWLTKAWSHRCFYRTLDLKFKMHV